MIDDNIVFGKTSAQHNRRLQEVLFWLRNASVTLNCDKCAFGASSVKFLGVIVATEGTSQDQDKVAAIKDMPAPQDV